MKLKHRLAALLTILVFGLSLPQVLLAAQGHHGVGTVKTIEAKERRIELEHGPIKSIGWMAMKMFFDVEDRELLKDVKVGDKVTFEFIKTKDGRFVVTDIERND